MPTALISKGRKVHGTSSKNSNNSRKTSGDQVRSAAKVKKHQAEDDSMLVLDEISRLTEAAKQGHLSERGRTTQFDGVQLEIVEKINEMLDVTLLPIDEAKRILAQISNGKIDEQITATYQGDHEKIKSAVNNVAKVIQMLENMLGRLTTAVKEGRLTERGKPELMKGAYAESSAA